jgi:hypothetical protein
MFQAVVIKHFRQIFVMAVSHIAIGKKTYFYLFVLCRIWYSHFYFFLIIVYIVKKNHKTPRPECNYHGCGYK